MMLNDFSTEAIGSGAELELRVAQNVRIPCPACSQELNIRPRHVGKMGECRFCGHRFQARVRRDPAPAGGLALLPHLGDLMPTDPGNPAADLGRVVRSLEDELRQTWAQLTARQADVLGRLIAELGTGPGPLSPPDGERPEPPAPSPDPSETFELDDEIEALIASSDDHEGFLDGLDEPSATATATVEPASQASPVVPVEAGWPDETFRAARSYVAPTGPFSLDCPVELTGLGVGDVTGPTDPRRGPAGSGSGSGRVAAELRDQLDRERAESERLRDEASTLHAMIEGLRSEVEGLRSEVGRLRPTADTLRRVRAERDRLRVERDKGQREVLEARARLAELQLTLVEAEAELEDSRARARRAWEQRRQGQHGEAGRRPGSPEDSGQFEFDLEGFGEQITLASKEWNIEETRAPAPRG